MTSLSDYATHQSNAGAAQFWEHNDTKQTFAVIEQANGYQLIIFNDGIGDDHGLKTMGQIIYITANPNKYSAGD